MTRILHVLDHSLPAHSGYTFRTRALMKAQAAKGWAVAGVTGVRHPDPGPDGEMVDGLTFYRTPPIALWRLLYRDDLDREVSPRMLWQRRQEEAAKKEQGDA